MGDVWVNEGVKWLLELTKRGSRSGKGDVFAGLEVLIKRFVRLCLIHISQLIYCEQLC